MEKRMTREEACFLESTDAGSLSELLSGCLNEAQGQQYDRQKTRGVIRKVGNKTVVFVNNFSSFLQAYSGIVEIMKGADQQYGGVAYTTLSLFLIQKVAVNKNKKEERIDSTLLTLQREFSRVEILQDLYVSEVMGKYIAEAYRLGIEFAREAALYYSRPTYQRVLEAVTKPPQLGIDTKIAAITNAMTEIEKESRTLNSQRLHQVQQRIDEVQREVHDIKYGVEASHVHGENMSLSLLKDQLLPDGYEPNTVLDRYSSEVRESFKNPGRLVLFNMNDFVEGPDFRHWEEYSKPCMMLLHGRTAITNRDYSWLSPAVFGLIERCRVQDRLVIFHCCHDRVFMEQDIAAHVVISSLVYQLLIAKSLILRSQPRFEELRRKFADPSWCASSAKVAFAVLGELLDMFPEVYILLDRIDRIKGDADRFMDPLVNLVEHSRSKIKVFLVASSNNQDLPEGKMTPDLLENIADRLGDEMFSSLILNQK